MRRREKAFTLIEMVTVIAVITILLAIAMPTFKRARSVAIKTIGQNNLRQIGSAVSLYECDNKRYPSTSAYIECGSPRTWLEPTAMVNYEFSTGRSISYYLSSYIDKASVMYCPGAPGRDKHFQDAWQAGDRWDNPDTLRINDPLFGTYSYWWNYRGYLLDKGGIFCGPTRSSGSSKESKLIASCTFATTPNPYDMLDRGEFISCEKFKSSGKTAKNSVASQMWNRMGIGNTNRNQIHIKLNAVYTDGHVELIDSTRTTTLKISMVPGGGYPYFSPNLRGSFFVPTGN